MQRVFERSEGLCGHERDVSGAVWIRASGSARPSRRREESRGIRWVEIDVILICKKSRDGGHALGYYVTVLLLELQRTPKLKLAQPRQRP